MKTQQKFEIGKYWTKIEIIHLAFLVDFWQENGNPGVRSDIEKNIIASFH